METREETQEKSIVVNGKEHTISSLTAGQLAIIKQLNLCISKIQELELDLGQLKMAHDGFIHALENSFEKAHPKPKN